MLSTLEREHQRMSERINCLARNREAIGEYLERARLGGRAERSRDAVAV